VDYRRNKGKNPKNLGGFAVKILKIGLATFFCLFFFAQYVVAGDIESANWILMRADFSRNPTVDETPDFINRIYTRETEDSYVGVSLLFRKPGLKLCDMTVVISDKYSKAEMINLLNPLLRILLKDKNADFTNMLAYLLAARKALGSQGEGDSLRITCETLSIKNVSGRKIRFEPKIH
jgi:hypothetical protein